MWFHPPPRATTTSARACARAINKCVTVVFILLVPLEITHFHPAGSCCCRAALRALLRAAPATAASALSRATTDGSLFSFLMSSASSDTGEQVAVVVGLAREVELRGLREPHEEREGGARLRAREPVLILRFE